MSQPSLASIRITWSDRYPEIQDLHVSSIAKISGKGIVAFVRKQGPKTQTRLADFYISGVLQGLRDEGDFAALDGPGVNFLGRLLQRALDQKGSLSGPYLRKMLAARSYHQTARRAFTLQSTQLADELKLRKALDLLYAQDVAQRERDLARRRVVSAAPPRVPLKSAPTNRPMSLRE
ncbi:hypothetical protein FA95DRAFT_1609657 [Auriscalpium vulgare]|uniref:Uncharacterized protein n=1 Tax=Auriscalpium vulgare TaxID=40419 RepID=A0ACB8RGS7_9AGAM|nr:hypothetical protein FA95DRAFT_1609657 [Auriscalpium vulgare]